MQEQDWKEKFEEKYSDGVASWKVDELIENIESLLVAQRAELAKKIKGMKKIRKPTHGTCCTCQTCGDSNDYECQCPRNAVLDEVVAVLAL